MVNHIEDNYAVCQGCKKLLPKKEMIGMWSDNPNDIMWICKECLRKDVEKTTGLQSPKKFWL